MPSREFINDGRIVVYHLVSLDPSEIDAWAEMIIKTGNAWDKNTVYRSLHDLRHLAIPTHALRNQSERINQHFLTLNLPAAYSAVVGQATVLSYVGKTFVEWQLRRTNKGFIRRVFFDMDRAIEWLESV